jgi:hypothetical protein
MTAPATYRRGRAPRSDSKQFNVVSFASMKSIKAAVYD